MLSSRRDDSDSGDVQHAQRSEYNDDVDDEIPF
jgi:hypothetical protein